MLVRFKTQRIEKLTDGRTILFHAGDEIDLPIYDVRHLVRLGVAEEIKPTPPKETLVTPKPETAALPNTKETAAKPKPEGKPTPPKAQPKAE